MAGDFAESLPASWRVCRLDEVADVIDSLHKTPIYSETGRAMVRVTDVQGGFLDVSKALRVAEEVFREFTRRCAPKRGDIVFSRVGSYGNASYANTDVPFCLGQNTALLSPRINGRFLHLFLQSADARRQIEQVVVGSTQKTISLKSISALQVPIPPAGELEAIAHILGALDDKIELNRQMNETLEAMARAFFKSWFVDFDPVRAKAEGHDPGLPQPLADLFPDSFEDSELGEIPRGWQAGKIGSIASRVMDKVEDPADWAHSPLIDLSRMPQRSIALSDWGQGAELTTSVTRFSVKDTLFGAIRPYFHKVGVAPMNGVTNVSVFVLRANQSTDWPFVTMLCSMADTVDYASRVAKGTKMPVVSWQDFRNYAFAVPPSVVRAAFGRVTAPALERICNNIHASRTLAAIRGSLLPTLFSGELRVGDPGRFKALESS